MRSQAINKHFSDAKVDVLAVAVYRGEKGGSGFLGELNKLTKGLIKSVIKNEDFKGDKGETVYLHFESANANRLLLVGVGKKGGYNSSDVAILSGTAARFLRNKGVKSFALNPRCEGDVVDVASYAIQGAITSQFELDKYKTKDKNNKVINELVFFAEGVKIAEMKEGLSRGRAIGESMNFTRGLANEPPNILTPTEIARRARKMAEEVGIKCRILNEAQMKDLGMNSLLSVSQGSEQPAKLIVLKYSPEKNTGKKDGLLSFVGKGVMFDTGGISLKPSLNMGAMKYDMSGGATVLGIMRAVGIMKPSISVLGVVGCVENMPGGKASRPSDVVTAMNGKTIEILNTDAEGRLVLADAVAYAEKQGATKIVDIATLTGAVIIALGDVNTGIMGNDQDLIDQIIECGKEVGEGFWQLPLGEAYSKQIKSDIADVKNIGVKSSAGTIAGAVFIEEFIDKAKWGHLDIAGTAWMDSSKPHQSKGPTAVAVRSLLRLIEKSQ